MIEIIKALVACMESAIEAGDWQIDGACDPTMALINARKAIAEAEKQEPVAWMHKETALLRKEINKPKGADWDADHWIPLYTTPQQRTWVGMTDDEKDLFSSWLDFKTDDEVFEAIEAKLEEKNT